MKGFDNFEERLKLRSKFEQQTGKNLMDTTGKSIADYFLWLELLIINRPKRLHIDQAIRIIDANNFDTAKDILIKRLTGTPETVQHDYQLFVIALKVED